jgi:hypothetical protein
MPVGDLQWGSPGVDLKRIKDHLRKGLDLGALFIGTGDYTDFLSPSNRRYMKNAGLYDTATELIERWHREQLEEIKDILAPTRGMWLGLHEGHHYYEYGDGTTCDTVLAEYLGAPFLGTCAVTRLTFRDAYDHSVQCLIWSHHGQGGGSDPVAKLMNVAPGFPQVDIFIAGHNTQVDARPKDTIWFYGNQGNLRMRSKTQMFVAAGGFMQGYTQGSRIAGRASGSYVERGMMRPTAIGAPIIYVSPERGKDYNRLKISASVGD